jgi:hypothetical protein
MRYWWVSQNQTFEHEIRGGYLWSPKLKRDGTLNHYYETMREVSYGDIVFSFNDQKIMAMGIAQGPAYTCPKPTEFGTAGAKWDEIGWRVDVNFSILNHPIQPRSHMGLLRALLPERYSPLQANGTGNQLYLTEISELFAHALVGLIGPEAEAILPKAIAGILGRGELLDFDLGRAELLKKWDEVQEEKVQKDDTIPETEREQVIQSRRGQGKFRARVANIERFCRITHVDRLEHLIASHIKPWSVADNKERLDGENGLLLTPSVDHLFNNGYISFRGNGALIISPVAHTSSLSKMGIPLDESFNVGAFSGRQDEYLEYHRDLILLKARN